MKKTRTWHTSKAAWASAEAEAWRARAAQRRADRYPSSDWRSIRAKQRNIDHALSEAARFDRLAERLRLEGR